MALLFDSVNGFRDTGTGSLTLPAGTTEQRPSSPVVGMMRYNTTLGVVETFLSNAWTTTSTTSFTVDALIVAGGGAGGGGGWVDSGGGAGGMLTLVKSSQLPSAKTSRRASQPLPGLSPRKAQQPVARSARICAGKHSRSCA